MKQMTFVAACNKYFGRKEGQALTDFGAELKELGTKDREELAQVFKTVDIEIIPSKTI